MTHAQITAAVKASLALAPTASERREEAYRKPATPKGPQR